MVDATVMLLKDPFTCKLPLGRDWFTLYTGIQCSHLHADNDYDALFIFLKSDYFFIFHCC